MPASRRTRNLVLIGVVVFLFLVYLSRDTTTQTFYTRTVKALDAKKLSDERAASKLRTIKEGSRSEKPVEAGDAAQKPLADSGMIDEPIQDVEYVLRKKVGQDADDPDSTDKPAADGTNSEQGSSESKGEDGKSVAGRKKMKDPRPKEERLAEAELNQILKRSPVIIVSKTWCPYSAKAKRILTDKYAIVPRPHIVELDKHPLGAALQNLLEKTTGRRTVPNILINGKSIGGGDDIEASEIAGTLVEKIQNMGGKRITSLTKVREGD